MKEILYKKYDFISSSQEETKKIIDDIYDRIPVDKLSLDSYIENEIKEYIKKLPLNEQVKIINRYMSCNLLQVDNYSIAKSNSKKITEFFSSNEIVPFPELCEELLNKNINLFNTIDIIANKYINQIKTGNYDSIFNTILAQFIEIYCSIKGIEIEYEQQDSSSYTEDSTKAFLKSLPSKILSKQEQIELAKQVKKGDLKARDKLVLYNMRLVVNVAKKYCYPGSKLELMDLVQSGSFGLLTAIEKFDPDKGYSFTTYSIWWIRSSIMKYVNKNSRTMGASYSFNHLLYKYKKVRDELTTKYDREPTKDEIAKCMNISINKVEELIGFSMDVVSLNNYVGEDEDSELIDMLASDELTPEEVYEQRAQKEYVRNLLNVLDDKHKKVIILRYGLDNGQPRTLEEVGRIMNLTRERVRQIEVSAMRQMKNPKKKKKIQQDIREVLSNYSSSQIQKMIYQLTDEEKMVLDIKLNVNSYISAKIQKYFDLKVLPRIIEILENVKKEEAIQTKESKTAVLVHNSDISANFSSLFSKLISGDDFGFNDLDQQMLQSLISDDKFKGVLKELSPQEFTILSYRFGYSTGNIETYKNVSKFTGIASEDCKEVISKIITIYLKSLNVKQKKLRN